MVIVSGDDPATQKRYDRFRERIMFPIRNVKGEVIAFGGRVLDKGEPKYLNSPETPVFSKGRELYGLFEARQGLRDKGYVLVTEGYMDVVALAQLGFPNAVATLGTACTAEHVHKLLRFTEKVIFSFDGDAAGRRAAGRALEAALPHATDTRSFRFLFLPKEHDPDSYVREHGTKAFEQYVQRGAAAVAAVDRSGAARLRHGHGRGPRPHARAGQAAVERAARRRAAAPVAGRAGQQGATCRWTTCNALWKHGRARAARARAAATTGPARRPPRRRVGATPVHAPGGGRPRGEGGSVAASRRPLRGPAVEPEIRRARPRGGRAGGQRRIPRSAPKTPESRAVQMLFGHPEYWDQLSTDEHELLHALPAPYGPLVAWLERDHSEHGPRPWAILSHALRDDPALGAEALAIADGDADPDATYADFRRARRHDPRPRTQGAGAVADRPGRLRPGRARALPRGLPALGGGQGSTVGAACRRVIARARIGRARARNVISIGD